MESLLDVKGAAEALAVSPWTIRAYRALVFQTERLQQFASEQAQLKQIAENRDALWTELLRDLNRIVAILKKSDVNISHVSSRMADFASFALIVARAEGREDYAKRVLEKMDSRRTDMLLAEEPISECLAKWLEKPANRGLTVSSSDLNVVLAAIAAQQNTHWPYGNAHALGQRLSHITTNLREQFQVELGRDSANILQYRFWPKAESLNQAESHFRVIQAA